VNFRHRPVIQRLFALTRGYSRRVFYCIYPDERPGQFRMPTSGPSSTWAGACGSTTTTGRVPAVVLAKAARPSGIQPARPSPTTGLRAAAVLDILMNNAIYIANIVNDGSGVRLQSGPLSI
jgi:hypothetical protein